MIYNHHPSQLPAEIKIDFRLTNAPIRQFFTKEFTGAEVLTPNENQLIQAANPKRLTHFCTGRFCAKQAMQGFTGHSNEILRGPGKEPLWPVGVVGSISHSDELTGAVVASSRDIISIGLDIEKIGRVKSEMWDNLFTPDEKHYLASLPEEEKPLYTTLFFTMKESFYKLQYPLTKFRLWFDEVEIRKNGETYSLVILREFAGKKSLPASTDMNFIVCDEQVVSLCYLQ